MDPSQDYFALFGLPRRFALDEDALDRIWHALQAEVHPDQYAHAPYAEQYRAMQWSLRVNEAHAALKRPLPRARYLLELAGIDPGVSSGAAMTKEFLVEQMEWREAVAEARARKDADTLERLHSRLRGHVGEMHGRLARNLDESGDYPAAADIVRQLMFIDKLRAEIEDALVMVED
jgi:molecular chaperone HscB